jgi:hypothetical protein
MAGTTLHPFHSVVKLVGGILWVPAIVLLFLVPFLGVFFVLVAIILSILSLVWTRQARHDEFVEASSCPPPPPPMVPPPPTIPLPAELTASDRLRELQKLQKDGLHTDDEYEQKRKAIVDEI